MSLDAEGRLLWSTWSGSAGLKNSEPLDRRRLVTARAVVTQRHGAVPMLDAATEYGVAEAGGKRLADTRELARGGCVSKPLGSQVIFGRTLLDYREALEKIAGKYDCQTLYSAVGNRARTEESFHRHARFAQIVPFPRSWRRELRSDT
jgi:hypothetical protein